jgi:hypothetical protein
MASARASFHPQALMNTQIFQPGLASLLLVALQEKAHLCGLPGQNRGQRAPSGTMKDKGRSTSTHVTSSCGFYEGRALRNAQALAF